MMLVEYSGTFGVVTKAEMCYVHRWARAKSGARAEAGGGSQLSASSVNADSRPDRRAAPGRRRFPGSPRRWWIGGSSDRIPRRTLCSSNLRSPGPDWTVQVSPVFVLSNFLSSQVDRVSPIAVSTWAGLVKLTQEGIGNMNFCSDP